MTEKRLTFLAVSLLLLITDTTALVPKAAAQPAFPFTIQVRQADTVTNIGNGGTVRIEAPGINMATSASFTITYNDPTATTIKAIELTGSTDFAVSAPTPPFPLDRGESFGLTAQYLPPDGALREAVVTVTYTDGDTDATFTINLNGAAPEFAFTFTPAGDNASQVAPGDTLAFPDTAVETTSTGTFTITNRGSATGAVNGVQASGAFEVAGLPLLPTELMPDASLSFTVRFKPEELGQLTGSLGISLAEGTANFVLQGLGTGAQFVYELIVDAQPTPIVPGGAIPLGDSLVHKTTSVVIRVRNDGNTDGVIATIQVNGAAFSLADLPFLPATLTPGSGFTFTLNFTPLEVGGQTGRLRIGDAEFDLSGRGVGSFLEFSVTTDGATDIVEDGGAVLFPPTLVGSSASVMFTISNTGTADASIRSIALSTAEGVFELTGLPALPLVLPGGSTQSFVITFRPQIEGAATATLLVDTATFRLSGTGTPPAALPGYEFDGAAGTQPPRSQPAVGITLTESYPLKVVGTLTLTFASDAFADDPAIQFSTGGRKVAFEIPAGERNAIFPNGTTRVKVQTGTVAGTIILTPSFATEGGADLTPDSPPAQTLTILPAAPVITSAVIAEKRTASMLLEVTGYATTREVSRIDLSFQGRTGENLATTSLSINSESQFAAWYQSSQSLQFGSQFTVSVPLSFSGSTNSVSGQTNAVASITVTLANSQGESQPVTIENPE